MSSQGYPVTMGSVHGQCSVFNVYNEPDAKSDVDTCGIFT